MSDIFFLPPCLCETLHHTLKGRKNSSCPVIVYLTICSSHFFIEIMHIHCNLRWIKTTFKECDLHPCELPARIVRRKCIPQNNMVDLQNVTLVWNFLKAREILQELGSSYLLYRGSIFCCFFCLLSLVGSLNRKKLGANSTSHLGSMAVTSLMYSLVVSTSSW